ncbi:hypothetical protein SHKM778_73900 [Streptomyces sp. KM77-8]|uniref:Uncharacterized protein n=1 Tax=Streptomyces haneummycinicus TaxID=3074435 RepID=A0AAT9HUQ0_9ACTN
MPGEWCCFAAQRARWVARRDSAPAGRVGRRAVDRQLSGDTPTETPILRDRADVAAYAAYRMPATFEAVRSALEAFADAVPGWVPRDHTDVGGGTGAAAWAVGDVWAGSAP